MLDGIKERIHPHPTMSDGVFCFKKDKNIIMQNKKNLIINLFCFIYNSPFFSLLLLKETVLR